MIRPTIRQLEYLIALEKEQSFSKAAEYCNVTQSTLSAGIRDLEIVLDQKLVNRTSRTVNLTALGTEICAQSRKVMDDVDYIVARAQENKAPLNGTLRLGVIPTIAPYFLPEILPSLREDYPNLELQLFEDFSERLVEKLKHGALDVLLMAFPFEAEGIDHKILFTEDFVLACPKNKKPAKEHVDALDLDVGELLLLEDGHCMTDHALSACGLQKPANRKAYSATSLPTLIQMVNHGFGITLLPEMTEKAGGLPKHIEIMPFKKPRPTRDIGLAWKTGSPAAQDGNALYTVIKKYMNTYLQKMPES